jgi:hypothetical protein
MRPNISVHQRAADVTPLHIKPERSNVIRCPTKQFIEMSRPDSDVRCWAKLKCPVLPLVLTVCVPWFQYNAALKGSLEPALRVSPFS